MARTETKNDPSNFNYVEALSYKIAEENLRKDGYQTYFLKLATDMVSFDINCIKNLFLDFIIGNHSYP